MKLAACSAIGFLACAAGSLAAFAQTPRPAPPSTSQELEDLLFVQRPAGASAETALQVIWIPQPLQKYCLGKPVKECSTIDFCIRTTSKNVDMCRNLNMDVTRVPPYPPDVRPRRLISVIYFAAANMKGFSELLTFSKTAPAGSLDHLSLEARFRARIKFIRKADDDDFNLLEVLSVPRL